MANGSENGKKPKKKSRKRKVNWKEYNKSLVRRGEVRFDTDFLENWRQNEGDEQGKGRRPIRLSELLDMTAYRHRTRLPALVQAAGRLPERDVSTDTQTEEGARLHDDTVEDGKGEDS